MIETKPQDGVLDPRSFEAIAELAYRESGLQLVAEKTSMIQSRLRHRLRDLGLPNFRDYVAFVCSDAGQPERRHMISALTTNVSHFFREKHHFDILSERIAPVLSKKLLAGGRVRLWSAGCSNGQEACSIAMCLLEAIPDLSRYDLRILGTDIDPKVVAFANAAVYPERMITGVPPAMLDKYFERRTDGAEPEYAARPVLRDLTRFRELNLHGPWPVRQAMDTIFCRNVVIYFDLPTQNALWPRFRKLLTGNGHLFLGHSERIANPEAAGFVTAGPTTYRTDPAILPAPTAN
ncbi:protein-glutamate O-methyltransferase [Sulfitobacter sp. D35]|uniref:CheR family methyltransferase n=1 Tax=Sulfitobacter sp. D35 TaxID=3083252 RepID=UPI00296E6766|nr:protein-glutamate O-methyltransferase [Sulfitobacter sp. D35]MDW4496487.1 protein-glutamate O-methyltransferase [Sulfitobacter sp. D35]